MQTYIVGSPFVMFTENTLPNWFQLVFAQNYFTEILMVLL